MLAKPEAAARTRLFARVIGPFATIFTSLIIVRMQEMVSPSFLSAFFGNPVLVWLMGSILVFSGLLIIAFHQYWSNVSAVLVSVFGWFLALRGLTLAAAPQFYEHIVPSPQGAVPLLRAGFGVLTLVGLWLTYVGWVAKPTGE